MAHLFFCTVFFQLIKIRCGSLIWNIREIQKKKKKNKKNLTIKNKREVTKKKNFDKRSINHCNSQYSYCYYYFLSKIKGMININKEMRSVAY